MSAQPFRSTASFTSATSSCGSGQGSRRSGESFETGSECSVLGNNHPIASVPGKIIPQDEFYSYEAKYIDEHGAVLEIPAQLPEKVVENVQKLAIQAFQALECYGLARVDMFLTEDNRLVINEINTIPGFTNISMYPKLWEETGLSYRDLIGKLIELAIERHTARQSLRTSYR